MLLLVFFDYSLTIFIYSSTMPIYPIRNFQIGVKILTYATSLLLISCSSVTQALEDPFARCDDPALFVQLFEEADVDPKAIQAFDNVRSFSIDHPSFSKNEKLCRIEADYHTDTVGESVITWLIKQEIDVANDVWLTFEYDTRTRGIMYYLDHQIELQEREQ